MTYTELIEYIIDGDKIIQLLRWFPFFSKLNFRDIKTTGRHKNSQILKKKPTIQTVAQKFFTKRKTSWEIRAVKKNSSKEIVSLGLFRCLEKPLIGSVEGEKVHLKKSFGKTPLPFF